jgi:O-antigen/teichoic acid export membrane protein
MKFARAGTIYGLANVISAGVPFLLLPLLTRVLTPVQYGDVVNFSLLVVACSALAGMSVHGAVGVAWFRRPPDEVRRVVGAAVLLASASTLVAALIAVGTLVALGEDAPLAPVWGAVAACTAGCNVLLQCRLVLWQSQTRALLAAALQVGASALNVGLSLVLVLQVGLGGPGRNLAIAASALLVAGLAVAHLLASRQASLRVRRADMASLLSFGLPLIPHALAGLLLASADRFFVSGQLGSEALGVYGAAAQLGAAMVIVGDAFAKAFNPWIYARFASERERDALSAVGAMYAAVPVFVVTAATVGAVLWLAASVVLGPAYLAARDVLPQFMLGGAFTGMYLAVSGLYFYSGRTALLSSITLPVAVVGTLMTALLVARWGVAGAASGYAFTQGMLALAAWIVARRTFALPWGRPAMAVGVWWHQIRRSAV